MKLRGEFKGIKPNLMNKDLVPLLDICIGELLREKQRLITQVVMEEKAQNYTLIHVVYIAQGKSKGGLYLQCYPSSSSYY